MEHLDPNKDSDLIHRRRQFDKIIRDTSKKYDLDPDLISALIKVESDFDPKAVSKSGAIGLMQLMPGTAQEMKVSDPFDPRENVEGGVKYFKELWELFNGDISLAAAAYNSGKTWVLRHRKVPDNQETKDYVEKVLTYYYLYKKKK